MQLTIEKLIYGGDGLTRLPADEHGRGKTVFLPFVLPGEEVEATVVEAKPGFARAQVHRVLTPSPERVEPGCPYFTRCGGCHYQHIDYAAQLRYKSEILRKTLRRTAKFELKDDVVVAFRRAVGLSQSHAHARETSAGVRAGLLPLRFARAAAGGELPHQLAAHQSRHRCDVDAGPSRAVVPEALHGLQFFANHDDSKLMIELYVKEEAVSRQPPFAGRKDVDARPSHAAKKTVGSQSSAAGQSLSTSVPSTAVKKFAGYLRELLPELAGLSIFATSPVEDESRQRAPLTATPGENSETIGDESLLYRAGGEEYRVSAGSFFQTNRFLVDKLVEVVVGKQSGRAAVDLYAGAGLFTRHLARNFDEVVAVEASPHSFADLRHNLPRNAKCVRSTTEAFLAERATKLTADLIVLDPPRAGLGRKLPGR